MRKTRPATGLARVNERQGIFRTSRRRGRRVKVVGSDDLNGLIDTRLNSYFISIIFNDFQQHS